MSFLLKYKQQDNLIVFSLHFYIYARAKRSGECLHWFYSHFVSLNSEFRGRVSGHLLRLLPCRKRIESFFPIVVAMFSTLRADFQSCSENIHVLNLSACMYVDLSVCCLVKVWWLEGSFDRIRIKQIQRRNLDLL